MTNFQRMRGFFATTVGRPVALTVAFVTLIVVGLIAYRRIPLQLFPSEFTEPELNVWIANPGGNARENEERIARPIEEQLRTLSGIEELESYSDEGYVWFDIDFDGMVDMDLARAEVRDRIERAWPSMPETAEPAAMWTESADSMPISFFGITLRGDPDRRDYLMQQVVIPHLEAIEGIGNVDVWGVLDDSVRILLDEDKVLAAQLDLGAVIRRLSTDNFALPMGEVKDGGREILLRSDMRFKDMQEIADFPLGEGIKLGDVGRVAKVKSVGSMLTLIDGNYAYYGMATKDAQSNVVETSHNLRDAIAELETDPLVAGDISVQLFFVQGDFIESALGQLRGTAMWGGVLAVAVLLVFLRRVRLTLCVALSIPVSVLMAIVFEYFTGGSFNLLTMTGITLGIGMLVDNSVVVVENIARLHREGESALRAAVLGSRQIALAITLATLTTVVVFLPLIFMTDDKMTRIIFGGIGIPLSVSLMGSLLVAVVFLPVITARFLGGRPPFVQRIAALLAKAVRLPVRAVAWGMGGLRLLAYGALRGAFHLERFALRFLTPLRWPLIAGAAALVVWKWQQVSGAFGVGGVLSEFGVQVGPPAAEVNAFLTQALVVPALVVAALALFGLKRWRNRPALPPARPARFVPAGSSLVDMAVETNHSLIEWTLQHRLAAYFLALLALGSIAIPASQITMTPFGQDAVDDSVGFRVEFDTDFTLAESEDQIRIYADRVEEWRDDLGFEHWSVRFDENGGYFSLFFGERRQETELDVIEKTLREELPRIAGHRLIFYDENDSGNRSQSVVRFVLRGPDSRELEQLGAEAARILESVPGLSQVSSPLARAPEMIEVEVDREIAHGLGVSSEAVQSSIAWTLSGFSLPRYQEEGRDVPLVIEYDEEEIAGLPTLRDLSVWTDNGIVALSSFAELHFTKGSRSIYRRDGQTSFTLEAKVDDPLQIVPVTDRAYRALAQMDLPRGYSFDATESARSRAQEELNELLRALLLSIVLVFLLMAILFESFLLPFSVLFTIPFAVMGAYWALFVTSTPMDSVGWIGIIILAGVVVNNGIVLIDRIHNLRRGLGDRGRAVAEGCRQRVRPVLMTALTTVCGLTPMIVAEPPAQSMIDYRALATVVAGGLITSTFFTLWVVPLAYTVLDDLGTQLAKSLRWSLSLPWRSGRGDAAGSATPGAIAVD